MTGEDDSVPEQMPHIWWDPYTGMFVIDGLAGVVRGDPKAAAMSEAIKLVPAAEADQNLNNPDDLLRRIIAAYFADRESDRQIEDADQDLDDATC